ncbi:hypothetical protein Pla8534_18960 [Lignipirellula cremea]|uniref:Uncharacterized protein n=2 Tax=Lignipirellula cremea TaxID=2528010 RepID=A0A518DQJ1_9BACT|nr:hypothetical protein Pla8534_18960 [Lignipirellula cremea]
MSEDTQVTIDRIEMGTGWVCFHAGKKPPKPEEIPAYLNRTFNTWLKNNAKFKVRAVMPIV